MESIKEKLFKMQGLLKVDKDGKNPHFKSSYVTLDNLLSVLLPMCDGNRLLVTHYVSDRNLLTQVIDLDSKEDIVSSFPITQDDPQKIGSCITYAKRYNLGAIFNIITDVDDDANTASYWYGANGKKIVEYKHAKSGMSVTEYVESFKKEKDINYLKILFEESMEIPNLSEWQKELLISVKDQRKKYLQENEHNPFSK